MAYLVGRFDSVTIILPDSSGLLPTEIRVEYGEVKAGAEGFVNRSNPVSSKEKNACVIFEDS